MQCPQSYMWSGESKAENVLLLWTLYSLPLVSKDSNPVSLVLFSWEHELPKLPENGLLLQSQKLRTVKCLESESELYHFSQDSRWRSEKQGEWGIGEGNWLSCFHRVLQSRASPHHNPNSCTLSPHRRNLILLRILLQRICVAWKASSFLFSCGPGVALF